jgi:hypothetical protein
LLLQPNIFSCCRGAEITVTTPKTSLIGDWKLRAEKPGTPSLVN